MSVPLNTVLLSRLVSFLARRTGTWGGNALSKGEQGLSPRAGRASRATWDVETPGEPRHKHGPCGREALAEVAQMDGGRDIPLRYEQYRGQEGGQEGALAGWLTAGADRAAPRLHKPRAFARAPFLAPFQSALCFWSAAEESEPCFGKAEMRRPL